jgi:hypothetical protein
MLGNPVKVRLPTTGKAVLVPNDVIIHQKSHKAKREYKSATPLSDLWRILGKLCVMKRMGNQWSPKMW